MPDIVNGFTKTSQMSLIVELTRFTEKYHNKCRLIGTMRTEQQENTNYVHKAKMLCNNSRNRA